MADLFLQYLLEGDVIGFVIACYTQPLGETFYAIVLMMIFGSLYLRTRSLGLCAVLWFLLGSVFIALTGIISPFAVLLTLLGVVGILYTVFMRR